jgi:hypothetical protein
MMEDTESTLDAFLMERWRNDGKYWAGTQVSKAREMLAETFWDEAANV